LFYMAYFDKTHKVININSETWCRAERLVYTRKF